jgi:hypothetical protein
MLTSPFSAVPVRMPGGEWARALVPSQSTMIRPPSLCTLSTRYRIADASSLLIHEAAGRRGGSEFAGSVARDSANCAELALVRFQMVENNRLLFLRLSQLRDTRFCQEILSVFDMPCSRANRSAPSPIRKTCSLFSMTARASSTGFLTPYTTAIAPASSVWPSGGGAQADMRCGRKRAASGRSEGCEKGVPPGRPPLNRVRAGGCLIDLKTMERAASSSGFIREINR